MPKILSIVTLILALLAAGAALHAEEGESELDAAKRTIREKELVLELLRTRTQVQELRIQKLDLLHDAQVEALHALRADAGAAVKLLEARIDDLSGDLKAEQARSGVDDTQLGKQLMREQRRHTQDVVQLMTELTKANETAEANRIEATQALQGKAVAEEKARHHRDHIAHAVRLLGEIGPAARIALPWLKEIADRGD